jgi:hypothetical protein
MEIQEYREEEAQRRDLCDVTDLPEIEEEESTDFHRDIEVPEYINELVLARRVESELRKVYPCEVTKIEDGVVTVDVEAPLLWEARLSDEFNSLAKNIVGVKAIRVHVVPDGIHGMG